jgi:hypothetical protein
VTIISRWPLPRRVLTVLAVLALALMGLVGSGTPSQAQPASPIQLTRDVTFPTPPASTFAGASSGDGWDVQFLGNRIYNVFHHNSSAYRVDCHLQSDGSHCDTVNGVSPWPKTVTDSATSTSFTTPGHATGMVDSATGRFYGWTTRVSDKTGGVICVDLNSAATDPFCGFTALTGAGEAQVPFSGSIDGNAIIGSKMYAYNSSGTTTGAGDKLVCFDTSTVAACANQPISVGSSATASMYDWTTAIAGKVFVHAGTSLTCYDPATGAACAGSWPVTATAMQGQPFAHLTATGVADGVCVPIPNSVPCWDFSGQVLATPAALATAIAQGGSWVNSLTIGARVLVAGSNSNVYCYDFSTAAQCPNFPKAMTGSNFMYTVNADPVRFGCIWTNADGGTSQIQNFDAFTGVSGCGNTIRVTASAFITSPSCAAASWVGAAMIDPVRANYTTGTLDVSNANGVPIAGATGIALDGTGSTGLSTQTLGSWPTFGFTLTNPTFSAAGITVRLTWLSPNTPGCATPGAPTNVTATAGAGAGAATVSWTPPASDGGSPVTSYTVTAAPGGATCTVAAPATTCTVSGLTAGTAYSFSVTASNINTTSSASTVSTSVTPTPPMTPGKPTNVTALPGGGSATISWTPPTSNGGSAITKYVVTAAPGGATCTAIAPATTCAISGLTIGASYVFTVVATNAGGDGVSSDPSGAVVPSSVATAALPVSTVATFAG